MRLDCSSRTTLVRTRCCRLPSRWRRQSCTCLRVSSWHRPRHCSECRPRRRVEYISIRARRGRCTRECRPRLNRRRFALLCPTRCRSRLRSRLNPCTHDRSSRRRRSGRQCRYLFSKILYIVTLHSKYTRGLTFENL